jgi:hypothetical protein
VALLQAHRGYGVSTAAYYLGRTLVSEGLRVLVVDVTGRQGRLHALLSRLPLKNLALWTPPLTRTADLSLVLARARQQTAGRVDVLLLDADASFVVHAGGLAVGIDYAAVVTAPTQEGQATADRIAEWLGDAPPPYGKVGVVFARVDAPQAGNLPEQTENHKLPVIGYYPADYLLAAGDEYSLKGAEPSAPHEKYVYALLRLGRFLIRRAPLRRLAPAASGLSAGAERADPASVGVAKTNGPGLVNPQPELGNEETQGGAQL